MNKRVCDYFVVAGLGDNPQKLDNVAKVKNKDPITDIGVVFPELGETVPDDFVLLNETPSGLSANLNSGGIRASECYICVRRDKTKQPLIDIGVLYDGREQIMNDSEIVSESVGGVEANVSSSNSQKIFLTVRRNVQKSSCNILVVTDVCIINASRNELPPHSFCCTYKSLNKNMFGNEMFLCYKKSMNRPKLIAYKPEVICRYPNYDLEQFAFPEIVPLFCLPMGACLECWPNDAKKPNTMFSTFVLTVSDAKEKVYGSAITFYEDFQSNCLTKKQEIMLDFDESKHTLHVHKSVCILSHWPFSDSFDRFLFFLYDKVMSRRPLDIPIEKYVIQLIEEVPYPNPRTLIQLSAASATDTIILTKPEDSPIPKSAARFCSLLMNLKPDNCVQLLLLALTEQKILVHSLRPDILTATVEAVASFLFPFKWQCPYIPLCPLTLSEVLHAPLPFLIGVDSRFFDGYVLPNDINCVDLDAANITLSADLSFLTSKMLPKKATKVLKNTLSKLFQELVGLHRSESIANFAKGDKVHVVNLELEFQRRKIDQKFETRIQEAFLCFMATILKGYRSFLLPITRRPTVGTTDAEALFQMDLFLRSREKSYQKFFNMLMRTQMFIKFIEERSFVADGNLELAFFDDCIERLASSDDSLTNLLTNEMAENNDNTVLLLPPEKLTPESLFVYDQFILDINLLLSLKNNNFHSKQFKEIAGSSILRRTKQETLTAKRIALKWSQSIDHWAKYLLGTCYSLYIMLLPNLLEKNIGKEKTILGDTYELLTKANRLGLYCDEVCYRIMIQLCGEHSIPLLAVKLLLLMKRSGIQPNALTYGLYNRCVLEADWPAYSSSSQLLWNKLKYVVRAIACLRKNVTKKPNDKSNNLPDVNMNNECDNVSNLSFENTNSLNTSNLSLSISHSNVYKSDEHINNNHQLSEVATESDLSAKLKSYLNFTTVHKNFANDTNILRKMQKNSNSSKLMKVFGVLEKEDHVEISPTKDIVRTLVEESDPLGALEKCKKSAESNGVDECDAVAENDKLETAALATIAEDPVLFSDAIYLSASIKEASDSDTKSSSSSRPWRPDLFSAAANVTISNFGSSLKNTLSPSSYSGKKTSELLHGGLSSLKIAANSVAKKLDEIKEAISTPSKHSNSSTNTRDSSFFDPNRSCSSNTLAALDCESTDGNDAFETNRKTTLEHALHKLKDIESNTILEKLYRTVLHDRDRSNVCHEHEIVLSSCTTCHNCNCRLYDEDIMANWSAEDSNLNTVCCNCNQSVVPLLTVYVFKSGTIQDTYRVPYLNPLVLRKELENIMVQEGEQTLCNCSFVKEHPIVFWNLLWTFERIDCDTYFPSLYVQYTQMDETVAEIMPEQNSHPLISNQICDVNSKSSLKVKCIWDDPRMYSETLPLYLQWRKMDGSSPLSDIASADQSIVTRSGCLQSDIGSILCGNFVEPIQKYLSDRKSKEVEDQQQQPQQPISVYREMLFLFVNESSNGCDSNLINFDREYLLAYDKLQQDVETKKLFKKHDRPASVSAIVCRQFFKPLTLP